MKSPKLAPGHYTLVLYAYTDDEVLLWAENIDACTISGRSYFGCVPVFTDLKSTIIPEFELEFVRAGQFIG